jgi:serine phosphatase RsbU (regulator of sigma subunit)
VGYAANVVDALREERLDAPLPAATALRTGEAIWLESQEERDERFPALRGMEADTVSMCAVPLVVGGETIGALRFSFNVRRLFDEDERSFVLALAAQTAQTLKRSEIYAAERQASISLQRALLPRDSPLVPGWAISTYYRPAGDQEAGGDFYDVLPVSNGKFIAVIGDVMGRGIEAAAAMAQTRTMIRAYAVDDPDPAAVFTKVDTYFEAMSFSQLVTALYLLIDQQTGAILVGNAGHVPPLLVDGFGARSVEIETGTPFGVGGFTRTTSSLKVPPGASLVALTDGLVERRGEDIDAGIKRVIELITTRGARDATALVEALTTDELGTEHDDDLTVVALTNHPRH